MLNDACAVRPGQRQKAGSLIALRKIEERGANEIAKSLKAVVSQIFSDAIQCGLTDRNLVFDVKDVLKTPRTGHFAAIDADEIPALLAALASMRRGCSSPRVLPCA